MIVYRVDTQGGEGQTSLFVMVPDEDNALSPELLDTLLTNAVHLPEGYEVVGVNLMGVGVVLVGGEGDAGNDLPQGLHNDLYDTVAAIEKYCGEAMYPGWKTALNELAVRLGKWTM